MKLDTSAVLDDGAVKLHIQQVQIADPFAPAVVFAIFFKRFDQLRRDFFLHHPAYRQRFQFNTYRPDFANLSGCDFSDVKASVVADLHQSVAPHALQCFSDRHVRDLFHLGDCFNSQFVPRQEKAVGNVPAESHIYFVSK